MCVAPDGKLILADWRQNKLHAVALPASAPAAKPASASFNVMALDAAIGRAMRVAPNQFRATALTVLPESGRAVVAVESESANRTRRAWLAMVDSSGRVEMIDPARYLAASAAVESLPGEQNLWGSIPARSFQVTALRFMNGQLYAAGLSNADFSSTLRRFAYPLNGTQSQCSVEMYHTIHNQWETRAPIRAFAPAVFNGEPHLVAAYTCTPLIVVPMRELEQPRVKAKTVAELGYGNTPVAMVPFGIEYQGQRSEWILIANRNKSADLLAVPALAGAAQQPGLTEPVKVPFQTKAGVSAIEAPITGMLAVADQDPQFLLGLRRNLEQGSLDWSHSGRVPSSVSRTT